MVKKKNSVEVIIPTFNSGKYIIQAIKSIENQTLKPKKIWVIDDGSTDNTKELCKEYKSKITIAYIYQKNRGPNAARNEGLKHVTSDFVAFLDDDDEWLPTKLEKQLALFTKPQFANLGVVYSQFRLYDEVTKSYSYELVANKDCRGYIFKKLFSGNFIMGSASGVLIKTECFKKSGPFDEKLKFGEDWDMWLRLAEFYDYDYVDEVLLTIRRHSSNTQGNTNQRKIINYKNELVLFNKWLKRFLDNDADFKIWFDLLFYNVVNKYMQLLRVTTIEQALDKKVLKKIAGSYFNSFRLYIIFRFCDRYLKGAMPGLYLFTKEFLLDFGRFLRNIFKVFFS